MIEGDRSKLPLVGTSIIAFILATVKSLHRADATGGQDKGL